MWSYLFMLLWPAVVAGVSTQFNSKKYIPVLRSKEVRYKFVWILIAVIPLIYFTITRPINFGDTGVYMMSFKNMPTSFSGITEYMNTVKKDELFYFTSALIKIFISDNYSTYFAILAIFQALILCFIYRKYSENVFTSIFLFIASTDCISWMFNGIRQFTAVCITFACCTLIMKKKYLPAILIITIASFFHGTAFILIPLMFIAQGEAWNKKTVALILGVIISVLFINQFTSILDDVLTDTQYSTVISDWMLMEDNGTNVLRVIIYSIPALISLVKRKQIKDIGNPVINFCTNMSVASMGIYIVSMFTSGIYIGRLPIYFSLYSYILLPWEIKNLFSKSLSDILFVFMIIGYTVFYFYCLKFQFGII